MYIVQAISNLLDESNENCTPSLTQGTWQVHILLPAPISDQTEKMRNQFCAHAFFTHFVPTKHGKNVAEKAARCWMQRNKMQCKVLNLLNSLVVIRGPSLYEFSCQNDIILSTINHKRDQIGLLLLLNIAGIAKYLFADGVESFHEKIITFHHRSMCAILSALATPAT